MHRTTHKIQLYTNLPCTGRRDGGRDRTGRRPAEMLRVSFSSCRAEVHFGLDILWPEQRTRGDHDHDGYQSALSGRGRGGESSSVIKFPLYLLQILADKRPLWALDKDHPHHSAPSAACESPGKSSAWTASSRSVPAFRAGITGRLRYRKREKIVVCILLRWRHRYCSEPSDVQFRMIRYISGSAA